MIKFDFLQKKKAGLGKKKLNFTNCKHIFDYSIN